MMDLLHIVGSYWLFYTVPGLLTAIAIGQTVRSAMQRKPWILGLAWVAILVLATLNAALIQSWLEMRAEVDLRDRLMKYSQDLAQCTSTIDEFNEFSDRHGVPELAKDRTPLDGDVRSQFRDGLQTRIALTCQMLARYGIDTQWDEVTPCQNITSVSQLDRLTRYLKISCDQLSGIDPSKDLASAD